MARYTEDCLSLLAETVPDEAEDLERQHPYVGAIESGDISYHPHRHG